MNERKETLNKYGPQFAYCGKLRLLPSSEGQLIVTFLPLTSPTHTNEAEALSSPETPARPTVFTAMDRAQAIRENGWVLMAGGGRPF